MKNFSTPKLFVTTFVCFLLWSCAVVASDDAPPPSSEQKDTASPVLAPTPLPLASQAPPAKEKAATLPWWGIGLGSVVLVSFILYFVLANMERKKAKEFETTIIADIVSAIKPEYSLPEKDLRDIVAGIVNTHRCTDSRLVDLLRIEYEVEKKDASNVKRTTAVALKRQGKLVLKKTTRSMAWEDLPGPIRKEFILKNENVLFYSLYSTDEKKA